MPCEYCEIARCTIQNLWFLVYYYFQTKKIEINTEIMHTMWIEFIFFYVAQKSGISQMLFNWTIIIFLCINNYVAEANDSNYRACRVSKALTIQYD